MLPMILMAAAGVGMSLLQAKHDAAIADQNIEAERQAGEWKAEDRRAALREALATQRVLMASQGSNPDSGSNLVLTNDAIQNFLTNVKRGRAGTEADIATLKNKKLTAAFNGIAGSSNSLLKLYGDMNDTNRMRAQAVGGYAGERV
jgi:hypothetical protein